MNTPLPPSQTRYPLSSVQRDIWFDQLLYPDAPVYNLGIYCRINGKIDPHLFRQAITLLVQESDGLRLALKEQDGIPLQSFPEMPHVSLEVCDCSQEDDPLQAAVESMKQSLSRPFKIFTEPLFRYTLYKLSEDCHLWSQIHHHLVVDGRASALITQRVAALYNALLQGDPLPIRLDAPYLDFVENDSAYLASASFDSDRNYWQQKFSTLPEPLLSSRTGYANRTDVIPGAVHTWFLPRSQYTQLDAFAQSHSVSAYHVLLGLLYVYFTRVQDQEECVIGLPVLNRHTPAFKETIGLFVNTIPARFSYGREIGFVGLIRAIAGTLRESHSSQRCPLSEINRLAGVFQAGRKRLSDLSLSFIKQDHAACFGSSRPCETVKLNHGFEQIPLAVTVCEYSPDQDIQIDFSYNLAYFDADEIGRIRGRFMRLLDDVLAHPERLISELDILSPAEKQLLLIDWNATATPLPHDTCVHQLFETQAAKTPDATAVVFEDETLTYAELNARANQLAHALIALGVEVDAPVAIALERSPATIVALLATLKAGGAYVPLDPAYPADRLAFMLEDSGARILITKETLRERLPHTAEHTLCLDTDQASIATQPDSNPQRPVAPEHLAYAIYTSGSTGKPKGVALAHCGLSNLAQAQIQSFGLTPNSRVLQFASFSFDASVSETVMALCAGAALHLPNNEQRLPGLPLWQHLDKAAITHLTLPPTALAVLPQATLPKLESLIVAGEPCPPALAAFWSKGRRFFNAYGPTEATVCAAIAECNHTDIDVDMVLPIGRPIANTRLYVLDRHNQPMPVGVPGELHIGGVGLARGYLNRPELTAEKFIPDPFSDVPGARLYKTGDLVRYRTDGNLEFLGRLDHQVKIRGFRIELGEIEAALAAHPGILEAVVVARSEVSDDQRLVAYIIAANSPEPTQTVPALPTAGELRAFLKTTLPDYMLPAAFVFLPALPLTPNGKVDRKALPEPEAAAPAHAVAPRDALEEIIVGLWGAVLRQRAPGIHDNFFELGGHSLLAVRLAARLHDAIGIAIPVRWIFEAPTVFELAERIRAAEHNGESAVPIPANRILPGTPRITPDLLPLITLSQTEIDQVALTVDGGVNNVQDIYPLAPLQEGILFHHQLQSAGDAYLTQALLVFDSFARSEAFIAALQSVIDRHDILRTAVVWERLPEPVQVVWRHAVLPVEIRHFDPVAGLIADQLVESFHPRHTRLDLTRAPLLRIVLAEDGEHWLLLFLSHHLIMDHTTMEVMLDEISAFLQGEAQRLTPPVPFRNFVAQARGGIRPADHEAFFRDMLGDIETPTAPFGLLDVQGDGSTIVEARRDLTPDLALRLRTQARRLSATPAGLCHLAWALVLSRCCGQDDVVFGTVLFGRMQGGEGVERALGMFINTLPLRITCDARPVAEVLRETQQRLLALMCHEHASLSVAQRCSAIPAPAPLFSSLLNYRHSPEPGGAGPHLEGVELLQTEERTNYPFGLSVDDLGEGFGLTAQVDASVDPDRVCAFMQRALESLVTALAEAPQTPLCTQDILPPAEKQLLLIDWNATATPLPQETCVHQLFETQAAKTPGATAVVFEDEILTYAELNARANQLAHALIALGVAPDAPVAIALERSQATIVALLATLKAGGAYVPLDPAYPADRLAFMLEDSGARILITQENLRPRLPHTAKHTLCLDEDWTSIAQQPDTNPHRPVTSENLVYVIYTSGSTGKPKGVAGLHGSTLNRIAWMQDTYPFNAGDICAHKTSLNFVDAVGEIFGPLLHGVPLVILPAASIRDPLALVAMLAEHHVTRLVLVPSLLRVLLNEVGDFGARLPALRLCMSSGEALPVDLARRFTEALPRTILLNLYGSTEIAGDATCERVVTPGVRVPIGRPIANTQLYVLDRHNQPMPVGVPGELHIGGVGLARGYLNRPALTAEKFIPDPFSDVPGARLYKTGDLVRYRTDGNIEFLGRLDHQVKIRGFRIELGEIEAALAAHPGILAAVVVARSEESDDRRLVAYIVAANSPEPTQTVPARPAAGELRAFLKATLPDYMLPAAFVFLPALPLTPNGKVDRKALPEPEAAAPAHAVAPRDAFEEILVGLWGAVLRQSTPGIHDNFFELGGHSLLATRLAARLRDAIGIAIPVRWIFESPTVFELAERIRAAEHNGESAVPIPANLILPGTPRITSDLLPLITLSQTEIDQVVHTVEGGVGNVQDIYPLAPLQEGILFHHLLQNTGDAYLSHALLAFDSFARSEAFIAALQSVIDRHDILRTAAVWERLPEPVQVVWRRAVLPVETRHFNPADGPIAAQLVESCHPRHTRLDLTRAPLLRIVLAEDGERTLLLFLLHHLIMDRTTMEVMLDEISAFLQGEAQRLTPPVPFRNFVAQVRGRIRPEAHEAFFRAMLGNIETPTTPFGLLDVQGDGSGMIEAHRDLTPDLALRLRTQARRLSATPAGLCHLAWALVLSRCCGQDEVVFGTVLFGRMQGGEGVERALGLFINTLPLRITCDARPVAEALRETQQRLLALMRHEHASLSLAQRCSTIPAPLFSSLLNYRHSPEPGDAGLHLEGVELLQTEERTNYPFVLSVDDLGEGFGLTAQVAASVDPDRICAFMQHTLEALVTALEEAPQTPLSELDFLPPAEKQKLLIDLKDRAIQQKNMYSSTLRSAVGATPRRHRGSL